MISALIFGALVTLCGLVGFATRREAFWQLPEGVILNQ
jgi:hypothetical protein